MSGRLLVGLRWWNEVSESGGSDWKFESLGEGQRTVNKKDSWVFWTVLYAMPPVWALLGLVAILKLNIDYLLLVVIAVLLSGANLAGYYKCSKAAQAQLKGLSSGLFASGVRVSRQPLPAAASVHAFREWGLGWGASTPGKWQSWRRGLR